MTTLSIESKSACGLVGLGLGMLSSFLGIGGGPINLLVLHYFFSMERKKAALNSLYIILFSQLCGLAVVLLNGSPVGGALPYLPAMAVGPAGFSPVPLSDLRDSGCLCMELYEIFRPFLRQACRRTMVREKRFAIPPFLKQKD